MKKKKALYIISAYKSDLQHNEHQINNLKSETWKTTSSNRIKLWHKNVQKLSYEIKKEIYHNTNGFDFFV